VKAYFLSEPNYEPLRKGSLWIEPLIGEAKDFHPLRRFFLNGLHKVNIEGMMIAVGQKLKRLIKHCIKRLYSLVNFCFPTFFLQEPELFQ
jgi:hypothetical protein